METEQERLKEILDEVAKPFCEDRKYSYDDPAIVAEVRTLLGLPAIKQNKLHYIGITGHIGAGKDHVANFLANNIERKCKVVKFATKLVEVTAKILGVNDLSLFQDRSWKEHPHFIWQSNITSNNGKLISPREALCIVGSLMRSVDPDIWIRALANSCAADDTLYIISDLRYENEMHFVQQNNGIVLFIENLQAAQKQHRKEYTDGKHRPHSSEELMWALYYEDQIADYRLSNSDYTDPKPLQDLLTFLSTV